jgi:UDPglucose 6-dehydrogenase
LNPSLLEAALGVNETQPKFAMEHVRKLAGGLTEKQVAVLGLAFKQNTDDVRESVALKLVDSLLGEGAKVMVYDPKAMGNARLALGDRVTYAASSRECLKGADCCVVATGWPEFARIRPAEFKKLMRSPAVLDGRRILDAKALRTAGVTCMTLGSGPAA